MKGILPRFTCPNLKHRIKPRRGAPELAARMVSGLGCENGLFAQVVDEIIRQKLFWLSPFLLADFGFAVKIQNGLSCKGRKISRRPSSDRLC